MFTAKRSDFPADFLWGASTASHQVEGGTLNQWSVWELAHASERAKTAAERYSWLPLWPEIMPLATRPDNYVSGVGVDHYRRYAADFQLLAQLNLNSFRFGIEWSRLQPAENNWDAAAIAHYRDYIQALKQRGIEPILNLWHWTLPVWFSQKGGFSRRSNLKYWRAYVRRVAEEFGGDLSYILTLNETNVYTSLSYTLGLWPPQRKNWLATAAVYLNLMSAHRQAYKILKAANPKLMVGMAQNYSCNLPRRPGNWLDRLFAAANNYGWNWWFTNRLRGRQDFVGFNFYFVNYYHGWRRTNPPNPVNDLGWYMEPARLYDLLLSVRHRYGKPIMVTENGVADRHDQHRQWWLEETIEAIKRATQEGVEVIGYQHWSLLDNFEWADGWWPNFGLVKVDRQNDLRRTPRPSALWWAKWLKP